MKKQLLLALGVILNTFFATAQGSWGTLLGGTKYDLQTNGSSPNRIVRASDGTLSAVWTAAWDVSFNTRGAAYVYFDGSNWSTPPTTRIGTIRTGWPDITLNGNGGETVIHHSGSDPFNATRHYRTVRGQGNWLGQNSINPSDIQAVWCRTVADGNYLHMIHSSSGDNIIDGIEDPILYYRSTDNGTTWDIQALLLEGQANFAVGGGDVYAIDAKNGIVAITAGSFGDTWTLWKSTDNGSNFETIELMPWSVDGRVLFDGEGAYGILCSGRDPSILIDNNDKIHVWVNTTAAATIDDADSSCYYGGGSYYPNAGEDWILYWNEITRQTRVITGLIPDVDGNGEIILGPSTYREGTSTQYSYSNIHSPSTSVDLNGNLYVTYFAPTESVEIDGTWFYPTQTGTEDGRNYRDIYIISSTDNGVTWSKPLNMAGEYFADAGDESGGTGFEEEAYPITLKRIGNDNKYHVIFQVDFETGINLQSGHGVVDNYIMYYSVNRDVILNAGNVVGNTGVYLLTDTASLGLGALDCGDFANSTKSLLKKVENNSVNAYPNPTNGIINISVKLDKDSETMISIKNVMGQEVLKTTPTKLNSGFNTIQLNLENLPNGVYNYTLVSDSKIQSGKIIKE